MAAGATEAESTKAAAPALPKGPLPPAPGDMMAELSQQMKKRNAEDRHAAVAHLDNKGTAAEGTCAPMNSVMQHMV